MRLAWRSLRTGDSRTGSGAASDTRQRCIARFPLALERQGVMTGERSGVWVAMEGFEHVVKVMLERKGYVVTSNVKFPVRRKTRKKEREEYQTHGYEVDVVAARRDSLILGSVKSYFGSRGVHVSDFRRKSESFRDGDRSSLYKLFVSPEIRRGIMRGASKRYGYPISRIQLAFFVGKFASGSEAAVRRNLARIRAGAGPVKVFGLEDIGKDLLGAISSQTYLDDPVVATLRTLKAAGLLGSKPARKKRT